MTEPSPDEARSRSLLRQAILLAGQISQDLKKIWAFRSQNAIDDAERRGRAQRVTFVFLTALISAYWVGYVWASVWLMGLLILEFLLIPSCFKKWVFPHLKSDPSKAAKRNAAILFITACVFCAGWAPAWWVGRESASYFAATWFACVLINAIVYSRDRLSFWAIVTPPTVCAIALSVTHASTLIAGVVAMLITTRMVITGLVARADRHSLLESIVEVETRRQVAESSNAAKSQFLATMSHELRTPLNAVIGYAELLEEDLSEHGNVAGASDASSICRAATHLLGLINDALDFSDIEAGRIKIRLDSTDVRSLISNVVQQLQPLAVANGNSIEVDTGAVAGVFDLDAQRLRQCLFHLICNACKFTTNGRVHVSALIDSGEERQLLLLSVSDNGPGISLESQKDLFEPFVQVDGSVTRKYEGAGLGLAVTQRLVRLMGGDLSLNSTVAVGSSFSMRLPVVRSSQ